MQVQLRIAAFRIGRLTENGLFLKMYPIFMVGKQKAFGRHPLAMAERNSYTTQTMSNKEL